MRVLVIGLGAREHAIVAALRKDPSVTAIAASPGNAGTAMLAEQPHSPLPDTPEHVAELARNWRADLVVVGPAELLMAGAADAVRSMGAACFGPSAAAAQIEGSKSFAKQIMASAGVPTAFATTISSLAQLNSALAAFSPPYVIKDDGLAGGKGVLVTPKLRSATEHATRLLGQGKQVLLETYLDGPEVSLMCLVDRQHIVPLLPAQDFKRLNDGDSGPNTGGMGAYAPLPWAPPDLVDQVVTDIVRPVVAEMEKREISYTGLLYAGLVLTETGPQVLEFNCRLGDPEAQVILPLLRSPLAYILHATATSSLARIPELEWTPNAAVTVVLAAAGYPGQPQIGDVITGAEQECIFLAGCQRRDDGALVSTAGRVLSAVGIGTTLAIARDNAYEKLSTIHMTNGNYRTDIALRAASGNIFVGRQA